MILKIGSGLKYYRTEMVSGFGLSKITTIRANTIMKK